MGDFGRGWLPLWTRSPLSSDLARAMSNMFILTMISRVVEYGDEDSDQEYTTTDDDIDLQSEIARSCDSYHVPQSPEQSSRMSHVRARCRGYSLSVERSPGLLRANPEPRSKSLRLKRFFNKDATK